MKETILKPLVIFMLRKRFQKNVDKMKPYTYNKSTVWFLSTPIR